jgi:cytochrome c2
MRAHASRAMLAALILAAACGSDPPAGAIIPGADPERGRELLAAYGCGGCHVIPGIPGAVGAVGPPLIDFGDRSFIAGTLRNEPSQLVRWIMAPQEIEPGTAMPQLGVGEPQARHMAAYLYTLSRGSLGPPHPIPEDILPQH